MSLSPQNQAKLSQYKARNFPPYYRFFVKVLKDADLNFYVARKQLVSDASLNIVNTWQR